MEGGKCFHLGPESNHPAAHLRASVLAKPCQLSPAGRSAAQPCQFQGRTLQAATASAVLQLFFSMRQLHS